MTAGADWVELLLEKPTAQAPISWLMLACRTAPTLPTAFGSPSAHSGQGMRRRIRIIVRVHLALALLACVSCGGGKTYYPVRGRVLVNGKPAEGVTVTFSMVNDPDPEPARPTAGTGADGSFTLSTYLTKERVLRPGAPAGTYVVTCFWLPPEAANVGAGQAVPDKLRGKYTDPTTSNLRVEIPEHAVELPPFELEVGSK